MHDAVVEAGIDVCPLVAEHGHRDSLLVHQESLRRVKLEAGGHAGPDAHNTDRGDHFTLSACSCGICGRAREVKDKVKTKSIRLVEAACCKILSRRRKHDRDAGELFFESPLNVVVIGAAANARA